MIDFAKVMEHVRGVIAAIEPNDSQERFEKLGVTVVRAEARFRDERTVEAGGHEIRARRFVIATGSSPASPPIPGIETAPHFTNETIFDNLVLPRHLVIVGGGPIGLEMAQAHRRLGAEVTVLEAFTPLAKDDPELAQIVLDRLAAEGVSVLSRVKITELRKTESGVAADIESEDWQADHLRQPSPGGGRAQAKHRGTQSGGRRASDTRRAASPSIGGSEHRTRGYMRSVTWPVECNSRTSPTITRDW